MTASKAFEIINTIVRIFGNDDDFWKIAAALLRAIKCFFLSFFLPPSMSLSLYLSIYLSFLFSFQKMIVITVIAAVWARRFD